MSYRIAIVIDPWDYPFNGTVVSTRRFVAALAARGFDLRLLTLDGPADGPWTRSPFEPLRIPGVNRIIEAMRSPLARPDRRRLRAALDGCDLVHVMYPFFLGRAAVVEARRAGIPVVCSFHVQPENVLDNVGLGSRPAVRALYRLFRAAFFDAAQRVVAPSEFAAVLLRRHGVRSPIVVVSNGVPAAFFGAHAEGSRSGPWRILSVGRLAAEKDPATLVRAVAASRHRDDIALRFAGAGPLQARLARLAERLGVQAEVGPVDQDTLLALYRSADLFVHCGAVELEGMSVLEAMAAGNAVLVANSPTSAATALAPDPMTRFEPGNAAALAARIDHWLDDPDGRGASANDNRARVSAFDHERSVAALISVYTELLGVPAGQPDSAPEHVTS